MSRRSLLDRSIRVAVLVLTVGLIAGPFAFVSAAPSPCSVMAPEDWTRINVPAFSSGPAEITEYVVSPDNPRLLHVTNGRVVLSSTDGGCTFRESLSLASANLSYRTSEARITDLLLASNDGKTVYLTIEGREGIGITNPLNDEPIGDEVGPRPHVLVSTNGGQSWNEGDGGLEDAFGSPMSIASTPGSGTAYLLVDEIELGEGPLRISAPRTLYASTDAGSSWAVRWEWGSLGVEPAVDGQAVDVRHLISDPRNADALWAYGPAGLYKSITGGARFDESFATMTRPNPGVAAVDVRYTDDLPLPHAIAFFSAEAEGVFTVAGDGGEFFQTPGLVASTALAPGARFAVATVHGDVFYSFPQVPEMVDISPSGYGIFDLQAVREGGTDIIYGRTARTLERRKVPPAPPPSFDWGEHPTVEDPARRLIDKLPGLVDLEEPSLLPRRHEVVLTPGETREIDYQLYLPGTRQIDVAFLVDSSDSMKDEINGLVESMEQIVNDLNAAGVHAYFGVAHFRSFQSEPVYERVEDIRPPDQKLTDALNSLMASGGGNLKSHIAALYQLATGAGQDERGAFIARGQEMNFRPEALPIVVHGTDEDFVDGHPNPSREQAAAALRGVRARHVGLAYENESVSLSTEGANPTESLRDMARKTGAYAVDPVDCNNDGAPDIAVGEPLVCPIASAQADDLTDTIGKAIVSMVMGLSDERRVELETDGGDYVAGVAPLLHPSVDFKVRQIRPFVVTVTCPGRGEDERDIELTATARDIPIATAELRVVCRAEPVVQAATAPLIVPPVLPPPPPRPPQLHGPAQPIQNPVTQAQAQTQAQSQAQAQAGLVTQRQQQPQVAAVKVMKPSANLARTGGEGADDLAFTRYTSRKHGGLPPYLGSYVVAAAGGAAFGLVLRVQVRRRYVTVRGGRRGRR